MPAGEERIQKILARRGFGSRRACEAFIRAGQVLVNGVVVTTLGAKANPERDRIVVNGVPLTLSRKRISILLNKPPSVMTTARDPEGRVTVLDLLPPGRFPRLFPVGRLDYDAEGLLLLTNDGALTERLLHPRYAVPRRYHVKVRGRPNAEALGRLTRGVWDRGERLCARRARTLRTPRQNSWIEVEVVEGRQHMVKRLLGAVGFPVLRIRRVAFGPLSLGDLPTGHFRPLTAREERALAALLKGKRP